MVQKVEVLLVYLHLPRSQAETFPHSLYFCSAFSASSMLRPCDAPRGWIHAAARPYTGPAADTPCRSGISNASPLAGASAEQCLAAAAYVVHYLRIYAGFCKRIIIQAIRKLLPILNDACKAFLYFFHHDGRVDLHLRE